MSASGSWSAGPWILVAAAGVGGLVLVTASLPASRRDDLARRLRPYIGGDRARTLGQGGVTAGVGRWLASTVGDQVDIERQLARAGYGADTGRYQAARARWALAWAGVTACLGALAILSGRTASPLVVSLAALAIAPGGVLVSDRRLRVAAGRRMAALGQELPAAADLLALSLGAGESVRGALARVAAASRGPCGEELGRVVTDIVAGAPLRDALAALSRRLDLAPVRRLADTVVSAADRGAPAAAALAALAADMREQTRRHLVEDAGRRQVAMLVPVVGLVLPAALLFAFYPAVVALGRLAG